MSERTSTSKQASIVIGATEIKAGERKTVFLPLAAMYTHHDVEMTVHVIHGRQKGPTLFVSAAIHGDEINGVEIIRRLLGLKQIDNLKGTLIAIPIVNVHGFLTHSRYLPDGRDLNRCFPGSHQGSLTERVAHTFFEQIVSRSSYGIDLHTGTRHRCNLPQIRADLSLDESKSLARAFGVPVVLHSKIRDGSLRQAGGDIGVPILLYEAGESLRFDEVCISAGVRGVVNVMRELGMLSQTKAKSPKTSQGAAQRKIVISRRTTWVRAPQSGILRSLVPLGAKTSPGSVIGVISDPNGLAEHPVLATVDGIVIGKTQLPLVHEGEALFHLAQYGDRTDQVLGEVGEFQEEFEPDPVTEAPQDFEDPTTAIY